MAFIHSEENRAKIPHHESVIVVRVVDVVPDNQIEGTWYTFTLEIVEWIIKGNEPGQKHVDSRYLLRVYDILGHSRLTERTYVEKIPMIDGEYLPINPGITVATVEPKVPDDNWLPDDKRGNRRFGVQGRMAEGPSECGLYMIQHEDGTKGWYHPSELGFPRERIKG